MKQLVLLTAFLIGTFNCFAQQLPGLGAGISGKHHSTPVLRPVMPVNSVQSVNSFYIDYDSADARLYGASKYMRYVWPMNNYYSTSDSSINYCIVAFDSLRDAYNDVGYNSDSVANLAVDSIFLMLGQENNSGIDDTLSVRIIGVDTVHGYPQPNNIYWANSFIIPSGTPLSGNWRTPVSYRLITYASVPRNRFAIMVEYYGNKMDTLGIVAGFGYRDSCTTANVPDADTTHYSKVRKQSSGSDFIANSFALWSQYQFIGLLPTQNGSNIYFDCDNDGQYVGGVDGESYIQNVQFIAHVKTNAAGIHEQANNNLSVQQNIPNPFAENSTVNYSLKENSSVSMDVFDLAGKKILSFSEVNMPAGMHHFTIDADQLDAGMYLYTITAGQVRVTKRLTVIK